MQHKIKKVWAREILDSRGNPTVEVDLWIENGNRCCDDDCDCKNKCDCGEKCNCRCGCGFGRAGVPSGASTGNYEAIELRDGDKKRYSGKGVLKAVENVNKKISPKLVGKNFDQTLLDEFLIKIDGTKNKSNLGTNAILGVSLAFAKAVAQAENLPLYKYFGKISKTNANILPLPLMNIFNGGVHAQNSTDVQEFMIVPIGAKTFRDALRMGSEVFQTLKRILSEKGLQTTVGDEGGFAPRLSSNEEALQVIVEAIKKAGYNPGKDISLALDIAATELYENGKYNLKVDNKTLTSGQMIDMYEGWVKKYPIISIEDGLAEDNWDEQRDLTERLGNIQIVGDDLFVTNIERLQKGIAQKICNSILIKLNQIGTVTETIQTIKTAKKAGYSCIVSHRSGETEDSTIADLAVGLGTGQIKTGSICRGERTAKYNQLLRIEEELDKKAIFNRKIK